MRYAIYFSDGACQECSSSDGALRLIAYRHRVAPASLVTEKTEERILCGFIRAKTPLLKSLFRLKEAQRTEPGGPGH
jgi:hypothetical protein